MLAVKENPHYTYADYVSWDEGERIELVDGETVMLAAPLQVHQEVVFALLLQLGNFLEGKPCKVFPAPFSVRLFPKKDQSDDTVFEPDILVVCDRAKLDGAGCNGAPDLIIEVLSPSTARYDRIVKFRKYQQAGVREYWIVDPELKSVQACVLDADRYIVSMYDGNDTAPVTVLKGCGVKLEKVFGEL
jgi:Uma2 family endonuclease